MTAEEVALVIKRTVKQAHALGVKTGMESAHVVLVAALETLPPESKHRSGMEMAIALVELGVKSR